MYYPIVLSCLCIHTLHIHTHTHTHTCTYTLQLTEMVIQPLWDPRCTPGTLHRRQPVHPWRPSGVPCCSRVCLPPSAETGALSSTVHRRMPGHRVLPFQSEHTHTHTGHVIPQDRSHDLALTTAILSPCAFRLLALQASKSSLLPASIFLSFYKYTTGSKI